MNKKQSEITSGLEHQLDVMVYHFYGLSYEEACVIDGELQQEDFEKYKNMVKMEEKYKSIIQNQLFESDFDREIKKLKE